ncbi:MAG TPA: glycoside hydrolase family 15 protein [Gaiellaceae bacterium]|nr:glycoside hydrolase family 15 protein [Gaiellaceae bacterium]
MTGFRPVARADGYPYLEDLGLIGDGGTAALVCRDGSIPWMCVPRFDAPPLFAALLDRERGGHFTVAPVGLREARQEYVGETGVLRTELRGPDGVVSLTDLLTLRAGARLAEPRSAARAELLRIARVEHGRVRLRVELEARGGLDARKGGGGLLLRSRARPDLDLRLDATRPLDRLPVELELEEGDELQLLLHWDGRPRRRGIGGRQLLDDTLAAWRSWLDEFAYEGPQEPLVRRSAVTLKLLDYFENGALLAAPTSSLPEWIGGARNWDYRYTWIRDAAFSVYAFRRIGLGEEAWSFLAWVLDAVERHGRPRVLYDLDGETPDQEAEDPELRGYRGSRPVRWGNGAADQRQHDVFGEIVDCAYQWVAWGGELAETLWARLSEIVEAAAREWTEPDHGIWEVRTDGRPFTYSAAMCQVALDRGATLAERGGHAAEAERWRAEAERIRVAIRDGAWNEERQAFMEHLDGTGHLDASVLTLPLRRVVAFDDPRMVATAERVAEELDAGGGLLYRYLPERSPDGLDDDEGAFLLCSFWLVDNLAGRGLVDEAGELYDSLCGRVNHLGLLSEQIHPESGIFLGNFPQAFSHVGLISSGVNLARRVGSPARGRTAPGG